MTMPAPLRPDKAPWPLPLEYDGDACVHDAHHRPVVDCFDCEDAEFIVRACNAHYELLAALKEIVEHEQFGSILRWVRARAAISRAEPQP